MSAEPLTTLQLNLECSNLISLDLLSKSDPFVVVYMQVGDQRQEVGRTETISNDPNAKFVRKVDVPYYFERRQVVRFEVYDCDDAHSSDLSKHDYIGDMECSLGDIMGSRGQRLARPLANLHHPHRNNGTLIVAAEERKSANSCDYAVELRAHHVDKKDFFGKSDPFIVISKETPGGRVVVYKTEVIKNTLNPVWKGVHISGFELCSDDPNKKLLFECFDWNAVGESDLIGSFETTAAELADKRKFQLVHPKKAAKKDYKGSGEVEFTQFDMMKVFTFVDYLRGGCQISLMVAVDFTSSNGDPNQPTSLHYRNPLGPNEYMQAIQAAGAILEPYDPQRLFAAFGFGARLPDSTVSHDFHLNFNSQDPRVLGVDGLIHAYVGSLNRVTLFGPTNFAPVIRKASTIAAAYPRSDMRYHVLLIITDGEITDIADTVDAIIAASIQPLSIIIVGVGSHDFKNMVALDGDDGLLRSGARMAQRDIVQFVPFRQAPSPADMAARLLEEVPTQVVQYMKMNGFQPKPIS